MEISSRLFAGVPGQSGDLDSGLENATFNAPHSICQLTETQFIVSDSKNDALRLINTVHGLVATVECTVPLSRPKGLTRLGEDLVVVNSGDSSLKVLRADSGDLEHLAGCQQGYLDAPVRKARFDRPSSVYVSPIDKTVYVADQYNHCIRYFETEYVRPDPEQLYNMNPTGEMYWEVQTLVGTAGRPAFCDRLDEMSSRQAAFSTPVQIRGLTDGNLLVVDQANNALRHVHVGARLVTTIVGKRCQVLTGKCVFHKNPTYAPNALDEVDRYKVLVELKKPRLPIEDAAVNFRAPSAAIQLPNGALLCACLGREFWIINPLFTDMRPLALRGEIGVITDLRLDSFDPEKIYAVDSTRHCIWTLSLREQLGRTHRPTTSVAQSGYQDLKNCIARRSGLMETTTRALSTKGSKLQSTRPPESSVQQETAREPKKQNAEMDIDRRVAQILGKTVSELRQGLKMNADMFKGITKEQEQNFLRLFVSVGSHSQRGSALLQSLHLFAAQKILSNAWLSPLTSLEEVLTGAAMACFLSVGISVEDAQQKKLVRCYDKQFLGCGERVNIELVVVVGQWTLDAVSPLAKITVCGQEISVQGLKKKAEFCGKEYANTSLLQYSCVTALEIRQQTTVPISVQIGARRVELSFQVVPGLQQPSRRATLQDLSLFYCFE